MGEAVYRRTLKEYKAAVKAAFGPKNKQAVLLKAAKDKDLSLAELAQLHKWARQQGVEIPAEDAG